MPGGVAGGRLPRWQRATLAACGMREAEESRQAEGGDVRLFASSTSWTRSGPIRRSAIAQTGRLLARSSFVYVLVHHGYATALQASFVLWNGWHVLRNRMRNRLHNGESGRMDDG